jgi:mono/diheme cytochrome c family protein
MANSNNPDSNDLDRIHGAVKREKADLPAGSDNAPTWAIFMAFLAAIFAGGQLGTTAGGYSLDNVAAYGPILDPRPKTTDDASALDPFQLAMKKGATTYALCGGCHQGSGMGVPGQFPPLVGSEIVLEGTEQLTRIVLHGLVGPVTVKGVGYNTPGGMPGQGAVLSDSDVANVITYIRNTWGNEGSMVTKEMVAKVREAEKVRTTQWTMAEMAKYAKANMPGDVPAGPGATAAPAAK